MADPKLGNRADELGQFEKGADFEGINRSGLPPNPEPIPVDVKVGMAGEIELTPIEQAANRLERRRLKPLGLQHSDLDVLTARLLEEPEQTDFTHPAVGKISASPSRLSVMMTRHWNREALIWYQIRPGMQVAACDLPQGASGRIVVRQDTLESEHSCRDCRGRGHTDEACRQCNGTQKTDERECPGCLVLGFEHDRKWACGKVPCRSCRATGWRAGIVVPEIAQTMPVTGVVVSLGPNCQVLRLGDRVLHSKYAGHSLDTPEGERFTTMRESEVINLIREKA